MNADGARRLEAENLASWLAEEVLGRAEIVGPDGRVKKVRPGDVAILLRKLTEVHHYIEPLRRRAIRYVVEGGGHFYRSQEIIDAVNLLRVVENPDDRSALVGVLRSPLGGLTDAEIYELGCRRWLDYRSLSHGEGTSGSELTSRVSDLYRELYELHLEARRLPVGEALGRIFDRFRIRLGLNHAWRRSDSNMQSEPLRKVSGKCPFIVEDL